MRYLTAEEVLKIHKDVVDETGGSHGVRDVGLLQSAIARPRTTFSGQELFPDVWTKAAVYLQALATSHAFIDGNKRTSVVAAARFLSHNGMRLHASNEDIETFTLRAVVERLDVAAIAEWFKMNVR